MQFSQTIYYKTVGKELHIELRTKALLISILLPLLSAGSVVLTHYVIRIDDGEIEKTFLLQVLPYCYLDTLTYMMGAYWYLVCESLSETAAVLAEDFQRVNTKLFLG
jgi:gustatory receptor